MDKFEVTVVVVTRTVTRVYADNAQRARFQWDTGELVSQERIDTEVMDVRRVA
jgi:hypothetical protein